MKFTEIKRFIRQLQADAWEEGFTQGQVESYHGGGMGEYAGPLHVNPYKEKKR